MPPRDGWDVAAIGEVAGRVNIRSVSLLECYASAIPEDRYDPDEYVTSHTAIAFADDAPIESDSEGDFDLSDGLRIITVFDHHSKFDHEPTDNSDGDEGDAGDTLHVFAVFVLHYEYSARKPELLPLVDVQSVAAFAEFNATFNAWPYWREYLQSTTVRMGLPPVTERTLSVPNLSERRDPTSDV